MSTYAFRQPKFIKTATRLKEYPRVRNDSGMELPEIAVAGRSNVGKSSLLNNLFHTRDLVKTSSTPGKTQALNFFSLNDELCFVDLPGYGYAKVPQATRKQWGPMVQEYFEKRPNLQLVLFLFDIRRLPVDEDRELLECICHHEKSMILVLTKIDKVSKNERNANTQKIIAEFGAGNIQWVHHSSEKNIGRKELTKAICEAINEQLQGTPHGIDE
jgi:GTP-binding protein